MGNNQPSETLQYQHQKPPSDEDDDIGIQELIQFQLQVEESYNPPAPQDSLASEQSGKCDSSNPARPVANSILKSSADYVSTHLNQIRPSVVPT